MIDKALRNILKLPHISNAGIHAHEVAVEKELISLGFNKSTKEDLGLNSKQIKTCTIDVKIAPFTYVWQPCGSQSFPDFIVSDANGIVHYIECKSSKDDKITWNSGFPKDKAIYIHSSGKHNKQSLVMGEDLWNKDDTQLLFECFAKMKKLEEEYKIKLKDSDLSPYCREMYNDNGKIAGHPDREERIEKVFNFLKESINDK